MVKEKHLYIAITDNNNNDPPLNLTALYGRLMASRPTATSVSLRLGMVQEEDFPFLTTTDVFTMIGTLPHLESLHVVVGKHNCCCFLVLMECISLIVRHAVGLRELVIENSNYLLSPTTTNTTSSNSSSSSKFLLTAASDNGLVCHPNLKRIRISNVKGCNMLRSDWKLFYKNVLATLPALEELDIENVHKFRNNTAGSNRNDDDDDDNDDDAAADDDDWENLCRICTMKTLKKINLRDCHWIVRRPETTLALAQALVSPEYAPYSRLEVFKLASAITAWNTDSAYVLGEVLRNTKIPLKELRIYMPDHFLSPIIHALETNQTLQILDTNYRYNNQHEKVVMEAEDERAVPSQMVEEHLEQDVANADDNDYNDDNDNEPIPMDHDNENDNDNNDFVAAQQQPHGGCRRNTAIHEQLVNTLQYKNFTLMEFHSISVASASAAAALYDDKVQMYLDLNAAGRKRLLVDTDQVATRDDWIHAIIHHSQQESVVYYLLLRNPSLIAAADVGRPSPRTVPLLAKTKSLDTTNKKRKKAPPFYATMMMTPKEIREEYEDRITELKKLHISEWSSDRHHQTDQRKDHHDLVSMDSHANAKRIKVEQPDPDQRADMQHLQSMLQSLMKQSRTTTTTTTSNTINSSTNSSNKSKSSHEAEQQLSTMLPKKRLPMVPTMMLESPPPTSKKGRKSPEENKTAAAAVVVVDDDTTGDGLSSSKDEEENSSL